MAMSALTISSRRACTLLACASLVLLAGSTATAHAVESFGSPGSGAGQFVEPFGITVDRVNGDIYVLDTANSRVQEFTPTGVFLRAWGWGVANGAPTLQTCTKRCKAGSTGSGDGQFRFAEGLATDDDPQSPSYGDVYVLDIFKHRVQKFTPTGKFLLMFGWDVNQTAREKHEAADEDICPVHPGDICAEGYQGMGPGQFEFPVEGHFLAVGATGMVYVGDYDRVEEFAPNGAYESQVEIKEPYAPEGGEKGGVSGLELDAASDMYVIRIGVASVHEYEPSGRLLRTVDEQSEPEDPEGPTPVVTLGEDGDLFILHGGLGLGSNQYIGEYDAAGAQIAAFPIPVQAGLHGMVYDARTHHLYVLDTDNGAARVLVFTPPDPRPFAPGGSELASLLIPAQP